jgi:hypothetical protein
MSAADTKDFMRLWMVIRWGNEIPGLWPFRILSNDDGHFTAMKHQITALAIV